MAFQTFENDENNSGQIKRKNLKNEIRSTWLGMRDSNPRMLGPEPSALPLGESPIMDSIYDYTTDTGKFQAPRRTWTNHPLAKPTRMIPLPRIAISEASRQRGIFSRYAR